MDCGAVFFGAFGRQIIGQSKAVLAIEVSI
jgi:hypothetical protein